MLFHDRIFLHASLLNIVIFYGEFFFTKVRFTGMLIIVNLKNICKDDHDWYSFVG